MTNNDNSKAAYLTLGFIAIVAIVAIVVLLQPKDEPDTALGRAAEEVGEGLEDAGRELDPNRTPGEKFGDAVEDVGEDIQDATDGN